MALVFGAAFRHRKSNISNFTVAQKSQLKFHKFANGNYWLDFLVVAKHIRYDGNEPRKGGKNIEAYPPWQVTDKIYRTHFSTTSEKQRIPLQCFWLME
ncbi:MAG: hypothetical protein OXE85_12915 [Roseovarius sp.]|nr:hypothetical protein [Roseovarius sp.]